MPRASQGFVRLVLDACSLPPRSCRSLHLLSLSLALRHSCASSWLISHAAMVHSLSRSRWALVTCNRFPSTLPLGLRCHIGVRLIVDELDGLLLPHPRGPEFDGLGHLRWRRWHSPRSARAIRVDPRDRHHHQAGSGHSGGGTACAGCPGATGAASPHGYRHGVASLILTNRLGNLSKQAAIPFVAHCYLLRSHTICRDLIHRRVASEGSNGA